MTKELLIRQNDEFIDALEASMVENAERVECPLTHKFAEGMYLRTIEMPKDSLITSKIHLTEHFFIVSKGKVRVSIDGSEWKEYNAGDSGVTKAGTRRVLLIVQDCVWSTVHLNLDNEHDVDKIEDKIIQKRENPLLNNIKGGLECHS